MKKMMAAAALLMMAACSSGMKNVPLEGTQWKLAKMEEIPAAALFVEEDSFTLTFDAAEHRVSGRTNCNRFFGSYEIEDDKIDFDQMGMTRMACLDMQYEDSFVRMLDEVDRFEVKGDELMLYDGLIPLATFKAQPAPAAAPAE